MDSEITNLVPAMTFKKWTYKPLQRTLNVNILIESKTH